MNKKTNFTKISNLSQCEKCSETLQFLLKKINILTREYQSLSFMMEFKDAALKNREEIISQLINQNQILLEGNKQLKAKSNNVVMNSLPKTLNSTKQSIIIRSEKKSIGKNSEISAMHFIPSVKINRSSSTDIKILSNSNSYQRNNESLQIKKITQFSGVETVTETQGLPQFHTSMNREGRRSILNLEEMKQLDQTGMKKLESWIFSNEGLKINLDLKDQIDLQENLKSFFCDFKRVIKNCANFKKAIKSFFSITSSLDLEQNLQRIMVETCDLLSCEKSSFFFLEELKNDSMIPLKDKERIGRLSISKGIAEFVINTGKILKLDNPNSDSRFSKEIDITNHFKTKNLICAPVKDQEGKILGLLQAVNKTKGSFMQEDNGIIDLLSMISGLSLKNSLMYDSVMLNEKKLFGLMEIISTLSRENDIKTFLIRSKEYLSQLIASKQTQVFLYDNQHKSLITFQECDKENPMIISEIAGIIGFVIEHKNLYEAIDPREDLNYNPVMDLNTDLPILTVPILDDDKTVLGIFQFTNLRNHTERSLGKSKWANYDLITLYATFLASCFRNILQRNHSSELAQEDPVPLPKSKKKTAE